MRWEELATKKDLEALKAWLAQRFADGDRRLDALETRLDDHDRRFDAVDGRFDGHDRRFDAVEGRFDDHDRRFDHHDRRFDKVDARFELVMQRFELMSEHIEAAKHEVIGVVRGALLTAVTGQTRQLIFTMGATVAALGAVALALARFG